MSKSSKITALVNLKLFVEEHGNEHPYVDGYTIGKPKSVAGNKRSGYETYLGDDDLICDAPCVLLYPENNLWFVTVRVYIPGPGPGDFILSFTKIDEAIASIIDYYFGDSFRMNPPELLDYAGE